jgi:origin recognition complex subunit 1
MKSQETNPFTYCEINGLKLPDAFAAYRVLWEAVSNHDVANEGHLNISHREALRNLTKYFSSRSTSGPGHHTW